MQGASYEEIAEAACQQEFATCSDSEEMLLFRPALFSEGPYNVVLVYAQTMALSQDKPKDQQHLKGCASGLCMQTALFACAACGVVLHIQGWHAKRCASPSAWSYLHYLSCNYSHLAIAPPGVQVCPHASAKARAARREYCSSLGTHPKHMWREGESAEVQETCV